jgi:thymidylate kinase
MEEGKSSVDKLVKAVYIAGGAYFGIELLKMAKDWWAEAKAPAQAPSRKRNSIRKVNSNDPKVKENYTFGSFPDAQNKALIEEKGPDDFDFSLEADDPSEMKTLMKMLREMKETLKNLGGVKQNLAAFEDKGMWKSPNIDIVPASPNRGLAASSTQFRSRAMPNIPNFSLEDIPSGFKRKHSVEEELDFCKICITGGPCAGKTTAIASISERLRELGYTVFIVPEAATMIFSGGGDLDLRNYSEYNQLKFQYLLLTLQKWLEDIYSELALLNKKKVCVLCDRGVMDGSAYLSADQWNTLITEWDIDVVRMRDRRYDLVIHLVTAADGAPEYYNTQNNEARVEDIQMAIDLDRKIQRAWMAHQAFVIIDNKCEAGFNKKIERVEISVLRFLGFPTSVKFYNKYLLADSDGTLIDKLRYANLAAERFDLEDTFVKVKEDHGYNNTHYIRKRDVNF